MTRFASAYPELNQSNKSCKNYGGFPGAKICDGSDPKYLLQHCILCQWQNNSILVFLGYEVIQYNGTGNSM